MSSRKALCFYKLKQLLKQYYFYKVVAQTNPPPWCDEQIEIAGAIDQYILYLLIISVIIGVYIIWKDKKKNIKILINNL